MIVGRQSFRLYAVLNSLKMILVNSSLTNYTIVAYVSSTSLISLYLPLVLLLLVLLLSSILPVFCSVPLCAPKNPYLLSVRNFVILRSCPFFVTYASTGLI